MRAWGSPPSNPEQTAEDQRRGRRIPAASSTVQAGTLTVRPGPLPPPPAPLPGVFPCLPQRPRGALAKQEEQPERDNPAQQLVAQERQQSRVVGEQPRVQEQGGSSGPGARQVGGRHGEGVGLGRGRGGDAERGGDGHAGGLAALSWVAPVLRVGARALPVDQNTCIFLTKRQAYRCGLPVRSLRSITEKRQRLPLIMTFHAMLATARRSIFPSTAPLSP